MQTRRLNIKENNRQHPIPVVAPTDFTTEPAEEIDPESVLNDPKFTLYCFDPDNDRALFVESSDPVAVEQKPFYYQGQAEYAVGMVGMPMETFHRIAERIPYPEKGLVWVHSVGSCGSTLISKALDAIPEVYSLSEPDDLTHMCKLRVGKVVDEEWLRSAIVSSTKWRCKPRVGPPAKRVAIKTRSEVSVLADLIGELYPLAKHVFLYREGIAWMQSWFSGYPPDLDMADPIVNREREEIWAKMLPLVGEYIREECAMNPIQVRMLSWITSMESQPVLLQMGVPLCTVRFEDLTADPAAMVRKVVNFCGICVSDWAAIHEVLGRDSREGSIFGREERKKLSRELTPEFVQDIRDIVATRPLLKTPDVVLAGTF
jgi:hypothetical protein